jgi:hypothetical protein|tara:strand:+ start:2746 stop:3135 length:390 start_codon:yes stop_codon:yes gene_type:complete
MRTISKINIIIILLVSLSFGQSVEINGQKVEVGQDDLILQVKGLVCSFCAHGLQKGMSKLNFVDKKRYTKGIYTDITHQYVKVGLKKNKKLNIDKALSVIQDAGYEVIKTYLNPSGTELQIKEYEKSLE